MLLTSFPMAIKSEHKTLETFQKLTLVNCHSYHSLPQADTDVANALNSHFSNACFLASRCSPATPDLSVPDHYLDKIPLRNIHLFILYLKI